MKKLNETYRIALTDDDDDDCEIFKSALESVTNKITLDIFNRGTELLEYLDEAEEYPHLIFLDLNMPVMHGFEVLEAIRRDPRYANLSIAIYSTSKNNKDVEEALAKGANIYLPKPNDYSELQQLLAKILEMNWAHHVHKLNTGNFCFTL